MLSRMRLGSKLLIAPMLVLAVMFCVSCIAWQAIARQSAALEMIVQQRAAQTRSAAELAASARQANTEVYQLITWISASFSQARTDTLIRGIHRRHAGIERSFASLTRLTAGTGAESALVHQAEVAWRAYLASVVDVIALARNDQTISANAMTRSERAFDNVLLRLNALTRHEQLLGERAAVQAADDSNTMATLFPTILMGTFALALLVTFAVRRALVLELDALAAAATALAEGDLRAVRPVRGRDEICRVARVLEEAKGEINVRLQALLDATRALGARARAIDEASELHTQALDLARTLMVFRLEAAGAAPVRPKWPRIRKGMPARARRGHPHLTLAASRP